tara:strand:- start:266 stop:532 length:267 start_codon:yes stop_codon:yes gene_type:complete
MDKKKTRATIGLATLGTLVALGYAYIHHNDINNGLNKADRKVKNSLYKRKFNLLRWKDNVTLDTLIKAEKKIKDLQDRTTSVRDIAWG